MKHEMRDERDDCVSGASFNFAIHDVLETQGAVERCVTMHFDS